MILKEVAASISLVLAAGVSGMAWAQIHLDTQTSASGLQSNNETIPQSQTGNAGSDTSGSSRAWSNESEGTSDSGMSGSSRTGSGTSQMHDPGEKESAAGHRKAQPLKHSPDAGPSGVSPHTGTDANPYPAK